jgi:hypothetical protein
MGEAIEDVRDRARDLLKVLGQEKNSEDGSIAAEAFAQLDAEAPADGDKDLP